MNLMSVFSMQRKEWNIMFFNNKEVFNLLTKENKKLRKENALMKNELNELSKYKAEYEDLIVHVKEQKERYMKLNKQLENLILDCESNLKEI